MAGPWEPVRVKVGDLVTVDREVALQQHLMWGFPYVVINVNEDHDPVVVNDKGVEVWLSNPGELCKVNGMRVEDVPAMEV